MILLNNDRSGYTSKLTLLLFLLLVFLSFQLHAQIAINTQSPDTSSILELRSTEHGLLVPRMTSVKRRAISSPAEGLLVFDLDDNMFLFYNRYYNKGVENWTGITPWRYRDDSLGYSGGYIQRNIYLDSKVKSVNVGTSVPQSGNLLTIERNFSVGNGTVEAPDKGIAVTGEVQLKSNLTVRDDLTASVIEGAGTVPIGGIIFWSGSLNDWPSEYELCDGSVLDDGTVLPDLSGRFIVGFDPSTVKVPVIDSVKTLNYGAVGNSGGENTTKLTLSQLPAHSHGGNTQKSEKHSHSYTDKYLPQDEETDGGDSNNRGVLKVTSSYSNTGYAGEHEHVIYPNGSGLAHENRPPYFVLAYIIRVK